MDDEGGEPIYVQVRDLRVERLPQKTLLLYSFERVCCSLLIYKVGVNAMNPNMFITFVAVFAFGVTASG
jgi:hypothetical protein